MIPAHDFGRYWFQSPGLPGRHNQLTCSYCSRERNACSLWSGHPRTSHLVGGPNQCLLLPQNQPQGFKLRRTSFRVSSSSSSTRTHGHGAAAAVPIQPLCTWSCCANSAFSICSLENVMSKNWLGIVGKETNSPTSTGGWLWAIIWPSILPLQN